MTDPKNPARAAAPAAASFEPAPVRRRHDGWTPDRQRAFIEHLADSGCVSHAARAARMTTQSAYALRRRHSNSMFAYAWDAAIMLDAIDQAGPPPIDPAEIAPLLAESGHTPPEEWTGGR